MGVSSDGMMRTFIYYGVCRQRTQQSNKHVYYVSVVFCRVVGMSDAHKLDASCLLRSSRGQKIQPSKFGVSAVKKKGLLPCSHWEYCKVTYSKILLTKYM